MQIVKNTTILYEPKKECVKSKNFFTFDTLSYSSCR